MNSGEFQQLLLKKRQEINHAIHRVIPIKAGRLAKDHFQEGFRRGGFIDGGVQAWQRKKRQDKYGPLMSGRQYLYGSINYQPADASVSIGTDVPYADIHNQGGDIRVTPRMKRYFWARYREENGGTWKRRTREAEFWKMMALKPVGSVIHIPRRKFIGESRELNGKIQTMIEKTIGQILS